MGYPFDKSWKEVQYPIQLQYPIQFRELLEALLNTRVARSIMNVVEKEEHMLISKFKIHRTTRNYEPE